VPAWFTVGQALAVAQLKGARVLFVQGRAPGVVTRADLERAPAADLVPRWAHEVPAVDADLPVSEARRLLAASGASCLLVERDQIVLGTVGAEELSPASGREAA
jgi:CBS domain-containing protein